MARESSLWMWLRSARYDLGPFLHMTRVENLVEDGTPDVEGCYDGDSFWCELKSVARPKRETTPCVTARHVRPRQVPWLAARWRAGGGSFFLIQVGEGHGARRYLVTGRLAHMVEGSTESDLAALDVANDLASPQEVVRRMAAYRRSH